MSERADRELVQQAQQGDRAALGELFSRYWRAARAAAFGVTGDFAAAEDAAAEAFSQAWLGLDSLRDPDRFGFWLRTIVVRKARLGLQSGHAMSDPISDSLSDPNERLDEVLTRLELGALVRQATHDLPDPLREALALVYFEGYTPAVAARFLDVPAGTLRRRLHEGRVRLRATVEQLLQGSRRSHEERERHIQRLKTMVDNGEMYQALRRWLALRPLPKELVGLFLQPPVAPAHDSQPGAAGQEPSKLIHQIVQCVLRPSDRASDPAHPVGLVAAAIRKALPHFRDWPLDSGEAAVHFLPRAGKPRDRQQAGWPPGFAEGHPGAFLRATRALVRLSEGGRVQSLYEHIQNSPDEQSFRELKNDMRLSDALDLTWMVAAPLELRSVQELLERLSSAVLPGAPVHFSAYDEPRYRSALQLRVGDVSARAAYGGVLTTQPGCPHGITAAHLRLFLEPWAALHSGQTVELDRLPPKLGMVSE